MKPSLLFAVRDETGGVDTISAGSGRPWLRGAAGGVLVLPEVLVHVVVLVLPVVRLGTDHSSPG